jgi:putative transcriptional regulator
MTINHHPSDETLAKFAAGTLPLGTRIVVTAHIEGCRRCESQIGRFEAICGALVDELEPTALSEGLLQRTLAAMDHERVSRPTTDRPQCRADLQRAILASPRRPGGIVLPRALDGYDVGPWRWLGPGIRLSRVKIPQGSDANVILLRVGANRPLPEHGHTGLEFTQVLSGSLVDGALKLLPGDLMEADADLQHQPHAGPEGDCISLAAIEGKLEIAGLIGRSVLSFVGL